MRRCGVIVLVAAVLASGGGAGSVPAPTLARLVGQKLVVSMNGSSPSARLLGRARRGEIGGVLLHRYNFASAAGLRATTTALQRAAARGGQPPLLVAVDQEGGAVRTVPWVGPVLAPSRLRSTTAAREQGRRTGAGLRALGISTDFAPVADVPASRASAVYRQDRTWSFDAGATSRRAAAFARGLADAGALATTKHFPGLGLARRNTDRALVRIGASRSLLAPGLLPFRRGARERVPLIMLSNAIYDAYDRVNAAGWSRAIATGLLRRELGFQGVSITDSLDGPAHVREVAPNGLAIAAANAGADLILLTGSEAATADVFRSLLQAARRGRVPRASLEASYRRIVALKAKKPAR